MHKKYDLKRLMQEIQEDIEPDEKKKGKLSQDDIKKMLEKKRKGTK